MQGATRPGAPLQADAVLSGGGIKVIGLAGALAAAESFGYRWVSLGGTSGGAIIAALSAAGYSGQDLARILLEFDFSLLADRYPLSRLPLLGMALSLIWKRGLCRGDALEEWLGQLLAAKGVRTFGDLRVPGETDPRFSHRLQIVTTDLTRRRLAVLPADLPRYGLDPDRFPVARAVRMSAALPLFYVPVALTGPLAPPTAPSLMVDGGVIANFPVWLFDVAGHPPWPTFGFRLSDPPDEVRPRRGLIPFFTELITTALNAREELANAHSRARTIPVPTLGVETTEFHLSRERRQELFDAGWQAATEFFTKWNFTSYCRQFRGGLRVS